MVLASLSGLILALAFPKPGIWALSWIGLVPLFAAMRGGNSRRAALYGLLAGFTYYGVVLFWISLFGYLPWALLAVVEALFFAAFAAVAARLMPGRIGWWGFAAVPALWTAIQWARSLGPYSLTWGSFAHAQADNLPIVQLASITGPWGIDFLVCLANLAIATAILPHMGTRRDAPVVIVFAITAIVYVGGIVATDRAPIYETGTRVAVLQSNLAHDVDPGPDYALRAFLEYETMSRHAADNGADLIVWPETSIPEPVTDNTWGQLISRLATATNANLLVGGYDLPDDASLLPGTHNGAHLYDRTGRRAGVYRKVRLVPFGEFVPLRDSLPFLKRYRIRVVDVLPGSSHRLLDSEIGKLGVSICFESLFPQVARQETRDGAAALLVMTNDSWFERTQAARQHLMMSRLRAVENRRFVIRAALTGISTVIDPHGRSGQELGIFRTGTVMGDIAPLRSLTPYTRFGDYFAYGCALIVVCGLGASFRRRGVRKKG